MNVVSIYECTNKATYDLTESNHLFYILYANSEKDSKEILSGLVVFFYPHHPPPPPHNNFSV